MAKVLRISIACLTLASFTATGAIQPKHTIYIEQGEGIFEGLKIHRTDGANVSGASLSTTDLTPLVKENAKALEYAKLATEKNSTANIWFWSTYPVGLALILSAFFVPKDNATLGGGLLLGGLVVALGGLIPSAAHSAEAQRLNFKAINEYNGVYDLHPVSAERHAAPQYTAALGILRF